MKKSDLRESLLQKLREEQSLQAEAAALARDEATSEESRARSKYDTHSQEAAYLAHAQGRLAAEIADSVQLYTALPMPDLPPDAPVAPGALIELESGDRRAWYFLGPRAGGVEFAADGRKILVLTTQSPLGRALVGRRSGDVVQTPGRGNTTERHRIVSIQ